MTDATAKQLKAAWDSAALPSEGDRRLCGQLLIPNNCQVDFSISQTQEGCHFIGRGHSSLHVVDARLAGGELKG